MLDRCNAGRTQVPEKARLHAQLALGVALGIRLLIHENVNEGTMLKCVLHVVE